MNPRRIVAATLVAIGCGDSTPATDPPDDAGCPSVAAQAIAVGWNHSLAAERDGSLRAWGANGSGQLGLGDTNNRARATRVAPGTTRWRSLAGGSRHSCGIAEDGSLYCWGVNVHGQLGVGDTADRDTPTRVGAASDWVEVTCGGLHSCGLRAGGTLWCWGANPAGQLGLGSETGDQTAPRRVGAEQGWRGLAAKARFNCALRSDESLWCWGDNSDGQLGQGDTTDRRAPVQVAAGTRWAQVRMGPLHTCAVTANRELFCWGLNDFGQLGTGDTTSSRAPRRVGVERDWALVSGGFEHSCGVRSDGSLWCWGNGALGRLGVEGDPSRTSPTRVSWTRSRTRDVVTGQGHTCALDDTNALRCWGDNSAGQVGDEASSARSEPRAVCLTP